MSAPPAVRWVTRWEAEGPTLMAVGGLAVVTFVAVGIAAVSLPPGTHNAVTVAVVGLPLAAAAFFIYRVVKALERTRTADMKAAADKLGLAFADTTEPGRAVLPAEFPLAVWANKLWPERDRRPRNVLAGSVGGRAVVVFDQRYPQGRNQITVTAVYLPDPIPGLPDFPGERTFWSLTGRWPTPDAVKPVLEKYPLLTVEARGGRVLVYRDQFLVHPDGLADFLALAGRVYADLAAVA